MKRKAMAFGLIRGRPFALMALAVMALLTASCMLKPPGPFRSMDNTARRAGGMGAVPVAPVVPPYGILFSDLKAPLDYELGNEGSPTVVSNMKHGTSREVHYIKLIYPVLSFSWGDCSIEDAAAEGDIKTIHYADYEWLTVLTFYSRVSVTVYGE